MDLFGVALLFDIPVASCAVISTAIGTALGAIGKSLSGQVSPGFLRGGVLEEAANGVTRQRYDFLEEEVEVV
jgi:hypothetical protein